MVDGAVIQRSTLDPGGYPQGGIDLDAIYGSNDRKRVLIIDDDPDTVSLLKQIISRAGFDVISALNCQEAVRKCTEFPPQMILLDLMLPDIDGWRTYDYLRRVTSAPVIIVSAIDRKEDVVRGLQIGADDYITKPFFNAEVVQRVRTVLNRMRLTEPATQLVYPDVELTINLETQEVTYRRIAFHLTGREFMLLAALAKRSPNLVSAKTLGMEIWGEDTSDTRKRIKYLVYLLRKKLEVDPVNPKLIPLGPRSGYRLDSSKRPL